MGCRLRGKSPLDTVAADSTARKPGSDLFSCTTAGVDTVNITGRKDPSRNWDARPIAKGLPQPIAAFANRTFYKVSHTQVLLQIIAQGNAFFGFNPILRI